MLGEWKEFKGKGKGTEAKCQEQGKNLGEKIQEQKRSARRKERV